MRLKKLEPIIVNKIVTGVEVVTLGKVVCLTYYDGSVDYRDRLTMAELYTEPNWDRINATVETGFTLSGEPGCKFHRWTWQELELTIYPGLQTALSPTNLSLVQLSDDGAVKWHEMKYTLADINTLSARM